MAISINYKHSPLLVCQEKTKTQIFITKVPLNKIIPHLHFSVLHHLHLQFLTHKAT